MRYFLSTNRKIASATTVLIFSSIIGLVLSLLKEIIVASKFGISSGMDAFYAALVIPNFTAVILTSTFATIFVPVFIKKKLQDPQSADALASATLTFAFIILSVSSLLIFSLAPFIIALFFHGLPPGTSVLATKALRVLSFTIIPLGLVGIYTGIYNSHERFVLANFSQILVTVSIIFVVGLFSNKFGVQTLAAGMLGGLILQLVLLSSLVTATGYRFKWNFDYRSSGLLEQLYPAGMLLLTLIAIQLNTVVDRVMASYLSPGSIASLGYADKLIQVPIALFSTSIASAIFPYFSQQIARSSFDELKASIARSINTTALIFIPLTFLCIILAEPLITVLFKRGSFGPEAVHLTAILLMCYSFQLFFYTIVLIFGKVLMALNNVKVLFRIIAMGVLSNVVLNLLFIKLMPVPVAGIALSTSVVMLISAVLFIKSLEINGLGINYRETFNKILIIIFISAIAAAGVKYAYSALHNLTIVINPVINRLAGIFVSAAAGTIIYFILAKAAGLREMNDVTGFLRQYFNKGTVK